MKKSVFMLLSVSMLTALVPVQKGYSQEKKEMPAGITAKVLLENDNVKVTQVTYAPGAVADWHSHPQYTAYAITDIKMKEEEKDKEPKIVDVKAGQSMYSPAITHKTTNIGKKPFTAIVTEIKDVAQH